MGTNYYLHEPGCPTCGHEPNPPLHIGKSSAGWCFSLHVINDPERPSSIMSLEQWQKEWAKPGLSIRDEYEQTISPEEMLGIITERARENPPTDSFDYYGNNAQRGPNNLIRHAIDRHCIGWGEGTWDLITGEFS